MAELKDKYQHLSDLLMLVLDGSAREEHYIQLNEMLRQSKANRRIYMEFMTTYVGLNYFEGDFIEGDRNAFDFDMNVWQEMLEQEKTAPKIVFSKEKPQRELIQKVIPVPREKYKMTKFNKFTLTACAAMILFFVYLHFAPQKPYSVGVVTLTDSINAKWANVEGEEMVNGTTIANNGQSLVLSEGYAEFLFHNQAKVTIQGPVEFQILAEDQIKLIYGRCYAIVPREAIGFTVKTPSSQIVDLGTEFGVDCDLQSNTSLHVIKGKTVLIAGGKSNKASVEVKAGVAKKVFASNQTISDIFCNDRLFAREINSADDLIWRGETEISLADIVGGGNGFNSGRPNAGIDTATGKMITDLLDDVVKVGSIGYKSVTSSPFIDGVFVPGLEDGMTSITADGSISVQFSKTSGNYWGYIFNGAFHEGEKVPRHTLRLNGVLTGTPENPSISIHSNQGITFDLSEIRKTMPDMTIKKFCSLIGISETVKNYVDEVKTLDMQTLSRTTFSTVDFWVFLDGRKVYELEMANTDEPVQVEIPVRDQDRFLTLAVTETDDGWAYDWALLGRPELIIEPPK